MLTGRQHGLPDQVRNDRCIVMPGHSRSKNGVASLTYVPGIHAFTLTLA
jgi:hypothetical protein